MSRLFHPYEIAREEEINEPLNFRRKRALKHVDRVFKAQITNLIRITSTEKLFHLRIVDPRERERFRFYPGQFVMLELPGYGEVPISISGSASQKGHIELCVRKAGLVTSVLHRAKRGSKVGIRGPFGTHFPVERMKGGDVLLIAGGLGLAPLRSAILHVTENRADFRDVHILYGNRDPSELLFDYQYEQWRRIDGVDLQIIVEKPDDSWTGPTGFVTKLLEQLPVDGERTHAVVCGPPAMFKFVCKMLNDKGVPMHRMFVSLERRMHCGMGKCCRCNVGSTYTCIDGPVFDYWSVMNLKEAI
jgi:NAD(P)H-flavin reductase